MLEQQQKAEIEKIIKELIATYDDNYFVEWWNDKLFYKIVGGKIGYKAIREACIVAATDNCIFKNLVLEMRRLAGLDLEYALYVGTREDVILDYYYSALCVASTIVYGGFIIDPVKPLVPELFRPAVTPDAEIFRYIFDKDPLTQVLGHATSKLGARPHLYVCPQIYYIEVGRQYDDLSYLFMVPTRRGVIAYCMSFDDFKYSIVSGKWDLLNKELGSIWLRVNEKLEKYLEKLKTLPVEERKKYCSVYTIKDLVSKEIEEVDELMKRYGIIRITIPLG